ncbi:hypothetical protein AYJ57_19975 [Salipiger sp. CCB-MM3]|nr:hypothetical protein AYJ57_19975 [Salipiger sp. CCB-MM3]
MRRFGEPAGERRMLLILGCQRSGTTMLSEVLSQDPRSDVFPEKSALSDPQDTHGLRLRPLEDVKARLERNTADLIVLKPLVESQNAKAMLDGFPQCRAVWMFRDYRDVVRSNLRMFGEDNGRRDLSALLNDRSDWRGENLSDETLRRVREAVEEPTEADAAALFWYARNTLFFQQALEEDPRVLLVPYEIFVQNPKAETDAIRRFAGDQSLATADRYHVSSKSVGAGRDVAIAPGVAALCDEMLARLNQAWDTQSARSVVH